MFVHQTTHATQFPMHATIHMQSIPHIEILTLNYIFYIIPVLLCGSFIMTDSNLEKDKERRFRDNNLYKINLNNIFLYINLFYCNLFCFMGINYVIFIFFKLSSK